MDRSGPQFRHPLVRAAVYHAVPFAERAAAHLKIADTLRDQPDRYAWHLAAAALEPDERVASLLEETAAQAQRRGGAAAAARALEHAAELSPGQGDRARRLLAAATLARRYPLADRTSIPLIPKTNHTSHHLDTPLARQNGQLYIDDLYVFPGNDSTVFIMDVNSDITGVYAQPGWRQVNRAGHPMMWPIFWPGDTDFSNPANTRHPSEDFGADGKYLGDQVAAVVAASGTSGDPQGYGQTVARELFPDVLPYVIGTPASYGFATRNGRTLADNAPEVMLSLVAGMAVPSGLTPSIAGQLRDKDFPYVVAA